MAVTSKVQHGILVSHWIRSRSTYHEDATIWLPLNEDGPRTISERASWSNSKWHDTTCRKTCCVHSGLLRGLENLRVLLIRRDWLLIDPIYINTLTVKGTEQFNVVLPTAWGPFTHQSGLLLRKSRVWNQKDTLSGSTLTYYARR